MDRQDIDALLIGALYGELTPADEARLAAHLESHPTDRGALDDLKGARAAVRESRIFDLQLDPPQAVSALLLQEAHRRAPKRAAAQTSDEKESWFYRFTRVFMAHPAMAAAAMLVLVVGVFGTLYVKRGADAQFAETYATSPQLEAQQDLAKNEAPAAVPHGEPATGMAAGSAAVAAAPEAADQGGADTGAAEGQAQAGYAVQLADSARGRADADRRRAEETAKTKRQVAAADANKKSTGMVVSTPQPQPKELDAPRAKAGAKGTASASKGDLAGNDDALDNFAQAPVAAGPTVGGASGAGATASQRAPSRNAPAQAAPASPAPPPPAVAQAPSTSSATVAKPSPTKAAEKPADGKAEAAPAKDNSLLAWAKTEHSRTVALANKGDCNAAAKAAVQVLNRAPDYYAQFMATDRLLKKCQAYIAQERDAEAERSGKLRSQKRATSDEPAATSK